MDLHSEFDERMKFSKVDFDVLREMVRMGFDVREVIGSLQSHEQNEVMKLHCCYMMIIIIHGCSLLMFRVSGYRCVLHAAASSR